MVSRAAWRWVGVGLLLALPGPADARKLASVQMEDAEAVGGRRLALRHMALKEKLFLDVYVWGLYLEEPPQAAEPVPLLVAATGTGTGVGGAGGLEEEAAPSDTAKRLRFHLKRSLSRRQLVQGIREALAGYPALQAPELRSSLDSLIDVLHDVRRGDELIITYVPGEGTYVTGKVRYATLIPGRDFADALFNAWMEQNRL